MIKCQNCDHDNPDGAKHCLDCGANLTTKKYKRTDDPVEELKADLAKLKKDNEATKKYLQEIEDARAEEEKKKGNNPDDPNAPKNPKPKRTLFGD